MTEEGNALKEEEWEESNIGSRDQYDLALFQCDCTYIAKVHPDANHDDECDLYNSWDFRHGFAYWDEDTWELIEYADESEELTQALRQYRSDEPASDDSASECPMGGCEAVLECSCPTSCKYCWDPHGAMAKEWKDEWQDSSATIPLTGTGGVKVTDSRSVFATNWSKCRHTQYPLTLPNGTTVYASSSAANDKRDNDTNPLPDLGIYLSGSWMPDTIAYHVGCPDYGVPELAEWQVRYIAHEGIQLAQEGKRVEVGCFGGHGRTGLMLAVMVLETMSEEQLVAAVAEKEGDAATIQALADVAIEWVRTKYCSHAIESYKQEWYIAGMAADVLELDWPEYNPPAVKTSVTKAYSNYTWKDCEHPGCDKEFNTSFDSRFCYNHRTSEEWIVCKWNDCSNTFPDTVHKQYCYKHRKVVADMAAIADATAIQESA